MFVRLLAERAKPGGILNSTKPSHDLRGTSPTTMLVLFYSKKKISNDFFMNEGLFGVIV
jgi:hypothetical protein